MKIDSLQNKKVKEWSKLKNKKEREMSKRFLVEGEHLVQEAHNANCLLALIVSDDYQRSLSNYPFYIVDEAIMHKLSEQVSSPNVIGICRMPDTSITGDKLLFLEDIQDPGNVGTLIRSAFAFGFNGIYLSSNCADLYNEKVIRSSQGALFHLPCIRINSFETIKELHSQGYQLCATCLNNAVPLKETNFNKPLVLMLGNEGNGMSKEALDLSDLKVKIEMDNFESLNVGVAGSICMYLISNK